MFHKVEAEPIDTRYRMEVIGHYEQSRAEVLRDREDRAIRIEPGVYPVVASVSLDRQRANEGGVIFNGVDEETAEERTIVQFYSVGALRDLVQSKTLTLEDQVDRTILEGRALAVTPVEARRQAIRR